LLYKVLLKTENSRLKLYLIAKQQFNIIKDKPLRIEIDLDPKGNNRKIRTNK
jgi:hypothetical protein